jgi:hypothetical protein
MESGKMKDIRQLAVRMEELLRLETRVVAYRRLETLDDLKEIPDVRTFNHLFPEFCIKIAF